jgi:exodeoxyribonuclease VII large subunit
MRLARSAQRLAPALKDAVSLAERRLAKCDQALLPAANGEIARVERRLATAQAKLDLLDPNSPLKRGYSLTFDEQGHIVRRAGDVNAGDELTTRLGEGEVRSRVE